jgi:hypothetical protein
MVNEATKQDWVLKKDLVIVVVMIKVIDIEKG